MNLFIKGKIGEKNSTKHDFGNSGFLNTGVIFKTHLQEKLIMKTPSLKCNTTRLYLVQTIR